uniref:nucleotidyltransferase domain-containing protein n=1 Tax=Salmonella sp. SAL4443 TaxID=3159898 RepID=UPI003978CD8B
FVTYRRSEAARQLSALADVASVLDQEGLEYWLFGGWAVDFYAGRITRPHFDVDLAVWLDDFPRIAAVLERSGWRHAPDPDGEGGTGYE